MFDLTKRLSFALALGLVGGSFLMAQGVPASSSAPAVKSGQKAPAKGQTKTPAKSTDKAPAKTDAAAPAKTAAPKKAHRRHRTGKTAVKGQATKTHRVIRKSK